MGSGGEMGEEAGQCLFKCMSFFLFFKKKFFFFYPYLLGLGRKGQKPRIERNKDFFPFNQKNTPWGQSEIPDNLSHLWKHDS